MRQECLGGLLGSGGVVIALGVAGELLVGQLTQKGASLLGRHVDHSLTGGRPFAAVVEDLAVQCPTSSTSASRAATPSPTPAARLSLPTPGRTAVPAANAGRLSSIKVARSGLPVTMIRVTFDTKR
jgi:hypothetical protein